MTAVVVPVKSEEHGSQDKTWLRKFHKDSYYVQVIVPIDGEDDQARLRAETIARKRAVKLANVHTNGVNWDTATWLISHDTFEVCAYLNYNLEEGGTWQKA